MSALNHSGTTSQPGDAGQQPLSVTQTIEVTQAAGSQPDSAAPSIEPGTPVVTQAAGSKQSSFDRAVYRVERKPRRFTGKALTVLIVSMLVLCLCACTWYLSLGYNIQQVTSAAKTAEQKLVRLGEDKVRAVNIAPSLRKSTVSKIIEDQSIPNYSYEECWNLDVSKPSGVTLSDLQLVSRGAFVGIEDAFLKAEQDYGINCLFVMAIASLESANGTMCFRPNNMFGFGSSGFSSKSECVDVVARALEYNYLTPGGSLYNGTRITD